MDRDNGRAGRPGGRCAAPIFAIGLALLGLASCGGGGGGGDGGSTDPQVSLTAPVAFASGITGSLRLAATASDDVGVASVEFQVDGVGVGTDAVAPFEGSVDTTAYASGQHVVRARARDGAGNLSAWSSATVSFGGSRTQPTGFTRSDVLTGLTKATAFAQAPDGSAPDGRFFVAEQGGRLLVVENGVLLTTPFITLTVDSSGERGLLGVALHPEFATNALKRWVYLYYTTPEDGTHNRISRYTADGNVVSSGSEVRIADLPALSTAINHNGGALHFGTGGKLYVGVGDNNNGSNAQRTDTTLGKMLRFNEDGTIPTDNPFVGSTTGLNRAIWATGLRNPFTFAVQAGSGRIHINDVGQDTWEEINLGAAGANYGWPASEGPNNITTGVTAPLFAYKHTAASPPGSGPGGFLTGRAIAGGAFYPDGGNFPAAYRGSYFFADFVNKFIGRLDLANGNAAYAFGAVSGNPVDMLVGNDGALYVLTQGGITRFGAP